MQEHIKKSFYYRILNINFLLVCPLAVLAPVATWIPLVLSSLLLIFFSKKFFKGFKVEANYIYLILASSWMVFSVLFLSRDIFFLQKLIEFFILVFSALIFNWAILNIPKFNKIIVLFSTSFIFSCLLIILDFQLELGLKLWLSKNFDFSNFQSFYQLKSWVSLYEFRNQQNSMILNYLNNTYDRGITSLIILALPISTICYLYNYKLLGLSVFILSLILTLIYSTFALKIAYMFSIIFASIFYLKYDLFKKYFLFFLALYFLLSPFILGVFNYKEFSNYEKKYYRITLV